MPNVCAAGAFSFPYPTATPLQSCCDQWHHFLDIEINLKSVSMPVTDRNVLHLIVPQDKKDGNREKIIVLNIVNRPKVDGIGCLIPASARAQSLHQHSFSSSVGQPVLLRYTLC